MKSNDHLSSRPQRPIPSLAKVATASSNLPSLLMTLIVGAISSSPCFAEKLESLAVKTYSHTCDSAQFDYRGSGTLFRSPQDTQSLFVLTSEHVLLQGTKEGHRICHEIAYQATDTQGVVMWKTVPAELMATDWQSGLAILKVTERLSQFPKKVPFYTDLIASNASGRSFEVVGLPYGLSSELRKDIGTFSATQSLRHLMPSGLPVFEMRGADGEFGMSGGPVFDEQGHLSGLLSHQFLVQRSGRPSAVRIFDEDAAESQDKHLILIRGADLTAWLKAALEPNFAPGFIRSVDDQLAGQDAVYAANMKFTAIPLDQECTTADQNNSDAPPPTATGGGDPVGVGGGDPVGVGGDGAGLPKSIVVKISLDTDPSELALTSRWNIPRLAAWHQSVTEAALRHETLEVPSIIYRDVTHPEKGVSRVCVRSLEEFFRKVIVEGASPVTHRRGGATSIDPTPQIKSLMDQGQKILDAGNALHTSVADAKKLQLIQYARMYGSLLASSSNWSLVKPSDLSPLRCITAQSCPYKKQWTVLFENAATAPFAQNLAGSLTKACNSLKTLTIGDTTPCD
jgi:hypothetical protein